MTKGKIINLPYIAIAVIGAFVLHVNQVAFASETNGTIENAATYAWGENLGWINFKPTNGGLHITDAAVSGYVWSQNSGWINFAPQGGGVTNTSSGVLGGHAWSSNTGWISFSGVSISPAGKFTGIAGTSSTTAGRINFDCSNCNVRTDWRPISTRTVAASTQRSGAVGGFAAAAISTGPVIPLLPETGNIPLTIPPGEGGKLVVNSDPGQIIVEIPIGASTAEARLSIDIIAATPSEGHPPLQEGFLMNAAFYVIKLTDIYGNDIHTFKAPVHITLPLPRDLRNVQRLGVYWLDDATQQWNKIPNAIFGADHVSFSLTHLTRFAIFATRSTSVVHEPTLVPSSGGAIVTEKQNADLLPQNISMERERIVRDRMERGTSQRKSSPKSRDRSLLIISITTLLSLFAYVLARKKSVEEK